jgi:hypothetical protein
MIEFVKYLTIDQNYPIRGAGIEKRSGYIRHLIAMVVIALGGIVTIGWIAFLGWSAGRLLGLW